MKYITKFSYIATFDVPIKMYSVTRATHRYPDVFRKTVLGCCLSTPVLIAFIWVYLAVAQKAKLRQATARVFEV
jgi:hypothetical protein